MKTFLLPEKEQWQELCRRPGLPGRDLEQVVREILNNVRSGGDRELARYSLKFDGYAPEETRVNEREISGSSDLVPAKLRQAIDVSYNNIRRFHEAQLKNEVPIETFQGVSCWRKSIAVEKAGLYIPGGSAPLFSTLLMLAIPAKLAGCREIIVCTPPGKSGKISPLILYAAKVTGITEIYKVGGAQAIAAMAYGTDTIPGVYKIFGPGNQYVTKAKELIQQEGIAIDMPAGPSEVLVISDSNANPAFVASDLLSQAEHGPDSQVIMLTDNKELTDKVEKEVYLQLESLSRKDIASRALENSKLILMSSLTDCIDFSNLYAPEHLIINTADPHSLAGRVINAGSVFLGSFSCESAGDYASGTNHTLPTNGYAKNYSGVSVDSFMKKITFQEINSRGIRKLGPYIELLADAESLTAHKNAVSIRLKSLENE